MHKVERTSRRQIRGVPTRVRNASEFAFVVFLRLLRVSAESSHSDTGHVADELKCPCVRTMQIVGSLTFDGVVYVYSRCDYCGPTTHNYLSAETRIWNRCRGLMDKIWQTHSEWISIMNENEKWLFGSSTASALGEPLRIRFSILNICESMAHSLTAFHTMT